jgi:guanine nucleotide-binding protein subunit alpha
LRNFQLKYAPSTFHAEAEAWRAIIDLNLVRSVTFLLRLLDEDGSAPVAGSSNGSTSTTVLTSAPATRSSSGSVNSRVKSSSSSGIGVGFAGSGGEDDDTRPLSPGGLTKLVPLHRLTDDLRRLHMSLSPLRSIEESLVRVISPDSPRTLAGGCTSPASLPTERAFEVSVRSGSRWKSLFSRSAGSAPVSRANGKGHQELANARRVIEACREDIIALWNHPAVRKGLEEQNVALEFQSGLYVSEHIVYFPRVVQPTNSLFSPTHACFSPFRPFITHGSFFKLLISLPSCFQIYVFCALVF